AGQLAPARRVRPPAGRRVGDDELEQEVVAGPLGDLEVGGRLELEALAVYARRGVEAEHADSALVEGRRAGGALRRRRRVEQVLLQVRQRLVRAEIARVVDALEPGVQLLLHPLEG